MTAPAGPRLKRRLTLGVAVFLGLALTALVYNLAEEADAKRIDAEFKRRADGHARGARERLLLYEEMVANIRRFFLIQDNVSRREFNHVAGDILERYPAAQALQWVQPVAPAERASVEALASSELKRAFVIKRRQPDGSFAPAPDGGDYLAILYTEPVAGNEIVLGYDLTSGPTAATLARTKAENRMAVSPQIRLAQSTDEADELGVILIAPVFRPGDSGGAASFLGFIQCVFRVETLLAEPHRARGTEAVHLYIVDLDAAGDSPPVLYANEAGREPIREGRRASLNPNLTNPAAFREVLTFGNRRWLIFATMNPVWAANQRSPYPSLIAAAGIFITILGTMFLRNVLRHTSVVEQEVEERTAELNRARQALEEDIRQREETEARLRDSEDRLRAILDNSPSPIFVKDLDGHYLLFNRPFEGLCNKPSDQIIGRTDFDIFSASEAETLRRNDQQVIDAGAPHEFEEIHQSTDGPLTSIVHKFPLRDTSGQIYALGGIITDITERLRADSERRVIERRLQASQKLESLGVLAGGIAHDFNNILTAVLGNASLARRLGQDGKPIDGHLQHIENAARRAADLCQQMLAYAGKGRIVTDRVDLTETVRGTVALLEVSLSKGTNLHLDLADGLPPVMADVTQLRQILMNFVLNASDAVGKNSGRIAITTFVRETRPDQLAAAIGHPQLPGGRYVGLEVSDNGCGMAPETVARIFEPFFTTKFSGRGLGLSAALGIVQRHNGALFVESELGKGSTFRLLLPASDGKATNGSRPAFPVAAASAPQLRGTVLVVDDEEPIRVLAGAALRSHGVAVLTAASGDEALEICRDKGASIDAILLDLTMPGISGEETLRRLRLLNAHQKIVLMSGYSRADAAQRTSHFAADGFLPKPFDVNGLIAVVRPLLPA